MMSLRLTPYFLTVTEWLDYNGEQIAHMHNETLENHIFELVTLTLDLWPWPHNSAKNLSQVFPTPSFVTLGQMVQSWERWLTDTHTHTHTHRQTGPILYPRPLTREGTMYFKLFIAVEPVKPSFLASLCWDGHVSQQSDPAATVQHRSEPLSSGSCHIPHGNPALTKTTHVSWAGRGDVILHSCQSSCGESPPGHTHHGAESSPVLTQVSSCYRSVIQLNFLKADYQH